MSDCNVAFYFPASMLSYFENGKGGAMKKQFIFGAALLAISSLVGADPLDTFCLANPPSAQDDPIKRDFYDSTCPAVLQQLHGAREIARTKADAESREAKRDSKRENTKADMELMKSATEGLTVDNKDLPDLAAFSSTAKRYISDLGYSIGVDVGKSIAADQQMKPSKTLIIRDSDQASLWTNKLSVAEVLSRLDAVIKKSQGVYETAACKVVKKPAGKSVAGVALGVAGVKSVIETANYVLDAFQPTLFAASSVTAPEALQLSVIAGIQTKLKADKKDYTFLFNPPLITKTNIVQIKLATATKELKKAAEHVEMQNKRPAPGEELEKSCIFELTRNLNDTGVEFKSLVSPDETSAQGSVVEQAARQQAMLDSGIDNLMQVDLITAGGAVTGYRRNRFTSIKLIASSDIALVVRWFTRESDLKILLYKSAGCGKAIPLGEFSSVYSEQTCITTL